MNKITISGIVTLIIFLSSATTYYIQDLDKKTSCKNGFEYVSYGEFEGYYKCITSSNVRYEMCFNVYNSANTENYWCRKGKIVEVEGKVKQQSGKEYICPKRPGPCIKR